MTLISVAAPLLDGEFVEADSAKLSDPTGTFGIKRLDTNAIVVADGEDLDFVNGDSYQFEFDGEDGVNYEAWFELVFDNETYWSNVVIDGGGGVVASKTLRFCAVLLGELVEFDPFPKLASPSAGYGVKRLADSVTVVESGALLAPELGGVLFARTFEDDPEGSKYRFYVEAIVNSVTYSIPSTTAEVSSAMLAIGRYTDSTKVAKRFGVDNMHLWMSAPIGDLDEPVDYAMRVYDFIKQAEDELDDLLNGAFIAGAFEGTIPPLVIRLATDMAGYKMYEARGVDDMNPDTGFPMHRLSKVKKDFDMMVRRVRLGLVSPAGSASLTPIVIPSSGGFDLADIEDSDDEVCS